MSKGRHGGKRSGAGRPKGDRDDVAVKVERPIAAKAKLIAAHRGVPVAVILSEMLQGPIDKAYAQMLRELDLDG